MDQSIWVQILMSLSRIKNNFLGSDGGKNKKNQLRKEVNQGKTKQTDGWTRWSKEMMPDGTGQYMLGKRAKTKIGKLSR